MSRRRGESKMSDTQPSLEIAALQSMPEAVIITDERHMIRFINSAASEVLNINKAEVLGQPFAAIPGGQDLGTLSSDIMDWTTVITDIQHTLKFCPTAIFAAGQKRVGTVIRVFDVTDEINTSSLLGTFFMESLIPLQRIHGYATVLLMNDTQLTPEQREYVTKIKTNAEWLIELRETLFKARQEQSG
jgi:transcriptional regulator with PAS, ATPase and Fis domain